MARRLGSKDKKKRKKRKLGLVASSGAAIAGHTLFSAGIVYRSLNRNNPHARALALKLAAFNPRTHLITGGVIGLNMIALKSLKEGKQKDKLIRDTNMYYVGSGLATGLAGAGLMASKLK